MTRQRNRRRCLLPSIAIYRQMVGRMLFYLLGFFSFSALAVPNIDKLGLSDGLSNNEIRCIYQDRQGYIWFGTYDGLNRYNGYDFKAYRNRPGDSSSIIHNYVNAIAEDRTNRIWIGTRQGVSILDPILQKFSSVYAWRPGAPVTRIKSYITDIKADKNGTIYVASHEQGLVVFANGTKSAGLQIPFEDNSGKLWNYQVTAAFVDANQHVYLMVDKKGLCYYDPLHRVIRLMNAEIQTATCMYAENESIWIGNNSGLSYYDLKHHRYDKTYREGPGELTSNRITQVMSLPNKDLWIGTDGGGVNILNRRSGTFSYIAAGFDSHSLSSNAVHSLLSDKDSRIWIGTLRGGINVIDNAKDRFQTITHDPTNPNSLINSFVKCVFEDEGGKLWIGTDGGGLSVWDRKANRFNNFRHISGQTGSLSSNFITDIHEDFTGKLWLTSYGGGINLYQPGSGNFKVYNGYNEKDEPVSIIFWLLYEDHSKNLWASGLQDGLFLFDRKKDRFSVFDPLLKNILAFHEDSRGVLWAGTFDGLITIDAGKKQHHFYPIGKPVRAIHEDSSGNLWLGTEAGLMLFDLKHHRISKQFTTDDGLCNNNVLNIEEDKAGCLWLSTYNGLSRFDIKRQIFTNFFQSDGLQNKEFDFNASATLKDGELAFGGINGLTLFYPQKIIPLVNRPNIVISDLKVNNVAVSENPQYIDAVTQDRITSLIIPYNEAALAISFSAIEFSSQERINYRYKMEGWDRNWNNIGHLRNAIYTRLDPGTYHFKVNCSNAEGQWLDKQVTLKIIVLPPWYATWWAYLIYSCLVIACIYWYMTYRSRETRLKYEIKLAKVNAENQQKLQEKEREINERRVEFFTGISHEFRTPLSLIINPVKDLLTNSPVQDKHDLNIVYRNARRLLSLVDQLLLFRKADASVSQLNVGPIHIVNVCHEVFLCFKQQAKSAGISYEFIAGDEELIVYGDREKIEIILYNLISNAIKYTPDGKYVRVTVEELEETVVVNVFDTGYGIPPDVGNKLFDKFYRSKDAGQPAKAGFGIGLYLAKQFTNDHHGTLNYVSIPDKGTTFTLTLNKGIAHYPEEIISAFESTTSELLNELTGEPESPDHMPAEKQLKVEFKAENIFTDRKAILIIDDDTEIRKYIEGLLAPQYVIYDAENADIGLAMAREKLPDLIICDVMMPGLNGIELCAIIKKDPALSYIPMILLTASSSPEGKIKGLESGADDYISKPFEKDILIARVANLLQIRSNLQSYFYSAVTLKSTNIAISEEYKQFLEKCIEVVEKHLADQHFNINTLASEIGMSRSNLFRKVKSLSGHSINSFIRYIRLRKAAELLIQSEMNINEVALETGFNNIKYFRTQFFKLFGANPSDFIRQKRPVFKKRFNVIE